ncbi:MULTISPECIES: RNA polymerase sigma factor FliA [Shewanella]|jgi:RNA polymerase sigma factor for flagellar operon FliA|uniref:RNA polymerase, sigma 28 subunit, FliA/WhiG family n=1 Tax=Shewanella baltica (strain OS155 / ATCC BAA-1091) TaxID=325240 RepID=A3D9K5_SHEB5|nr:MULTISPECIES: RNA polymerase sigma factor FliA [Shewanella]ABN63418.1 RNA polymerase, sigma 28 subunit, FliA/WhiG family [Shewanella baltica OS155]AEG09755.1 RNA polymerase, sigma 28 subunit, FliA/WhiG [Shewanella baltica BA175]AEH15764.1 RNA polymerase, sigma 28 subunit, FliA/WhiG [Shewanella baltica OS117]EHQ16729.1 RNA polymerase, sigma 28 subunit, FliA/WhiG [Shewanella baltica OS183]MCB2380921.1 RNA polymerase sigma factor FliA [Shewanella sp. SR1]
MTTAGQLAYQQTCDYPVEERQSEQQIIRQYLPLIKRIVSQMRSHCGVMLSLEDMEQIGMMALLESSRRYPGELDNGFISFAGQRIRGAILDELRRQDWRPRPVRQQAHELNDVVRRLSREMGREPSDLEVASALGLSAEDYRERLYSTQAESMKSLDELLLGGEQPVDRSNDVERLMLKQTLIKVISKLNEREQLILSLYYHHELNLKEIAMALGLTETRICQLHKSAISQLKTILQR